MAYNITAKNIGDDFAASTIEEILQHVREGWNNAHEGKPYERFESSYRQQGWIMYYNLTGGQAVADAFKNEVGYYPYFTR